MRWVAPSGGSGSSTATAGPSPGRRWSRRTSGSHSEHARPRRPARPGHVRRHRAGARCSPASRSRRRSSSRASARSSSTCSTAQSRAVLHRLELRVHRAGDRRRRRTAACRRRSAASCRRRRAVHRRPDRRPRGLRRHRVADAAGGHRHDRRPDRPQPRAGREGRVRPSRPGIALVTLARDPADRRGGSGLRCRGCRCSSGVVVGYVFAAILGKVSWDAVDKAALDRVPGLHAPELQRQSDRADRPGGDPRPAGRERRARQGGRDDDRAATSTR